MALTEEDYTASLYYDVESDSGVFYESNTSADLAYSLRNSNPTANLSYTDQNQNVGLYSEVTNHVVDFFYVSSAGSYSDPYGFSGVNGDPDGNWDDGFWFSVYAYETYVAEGSVILGETYESGLQSGKGNVTGSAQMNVVFQSFIAPDYVYGPPPNTMSAMCLPAYVYAGNNRTFNPARASYKAFQQIAVGIGGYSFISPSGQQTGYTFEFAPSVLQNT